MTSRSAAARWGAVLEAQHGAVRSTGVRRAPDREVVCAPGVEDDALLEAVSAADLAAFAGQSPRLATRYRTT